MNRSRGRPGEGGFAMAALLVTLSAMSLVLGVALPSWRTTVTREKEAELVFRGEQYARAIGLYQRKHANAPPPSVDVLVKERYLRKAYLDPITAKPFQVVTGAAALAGQPAGGAAPPDGRGAPAAGGARPGAIGAGQPGGAAPGQAGAAVVGVSGVVSTSSATSLRDYNGRTKYSEWLFVPVVSAVQAGGQGGQAPGVRGGGAAGGIGSGPQRPVGQPNPGPRPPGLGGGTPAAPPRGGLGGGFPPPVARPRQ